MDFSRIIFLGQSGNCREPMAAGILQDLIYPHELEIMARALVFNFPEPMNLFRNFPAVMTLFWKKMPPTFPAVRNSGLQSPVHC